MRQEREALSGDQIIDDPCTLWGTVAGNVTAVKGSKLYVRGSIFGDLTVEDGGRVHVFGHISSNLVVMPGAKVIHSGTVLGDAINLGGRLYIDSIGHVAGKVKTIDGETTIDPEAKIG